MSRHVCPKVSESNGALKPNIKAPGQLYVCAHCKHAFQNATLLNYHNRYLHKGVKVCKICHTLLASEAAMRKHMKTHGGLTEYKCNECGKIFSKRGTWYHHRSNFHKNKGKYVCTICTKTFSTSTNLKTHGNYHKQYLVDCEYCDYRSKWPASLKMHK